MATQRKPRYTLEEYLAIEREAEFKSEYLDGEIVAMVGASEPHNMIVANLLALIHSQFKDRPCRVYASDMRVDLSEKGLYAYPDLVALCGEPELTDDRLDNLRNPQVIIEVLSKSTEAYDRGLKFVKYRQIPSLAEYLLVAQDRCHIEHYVRQPGDQWLLCESREPNDTIMVSAIGCRLKLVDVYEKVELL